MQVLHLTPDLFSAKHGNPPGTESDGKTMRLQPTGEDVYMMMKIRLINAPPAPN
jgi:hypothetical protein